MNKNNDEEWDIIANQLNEYRKKFIKKQIKKLESNNQKQFKLYASNWEKQNCNCIIKKKEVIKMTKEECLKALQGYKDLFELHQIDYYVPEKRRKKFLNNFKCIENLIDEHFDNTPLELNDLEIEKPYWDNEEKEWCFFVKLHKDIGTGVKISVSVVPMMCAFQYKENRFYRKQVEE